jgi:hypothetical protein
MFKNIIIISIISLFLFGGCKRFDREYAPPEREFLGLINKDQFIARPYRQQTFDHVPYPLHDQEANYTQDDLSYQSGFQDGCQSSTSVIGNGFYRTRGPNIDADKLTNDAWYLRGFRDASVYCTFNLDWETQ